jgi:hypothetical protein
MSGWIAVTLEGAPERTVMVNADKILSVGSDPEGGARIVLTNRESYDVTDDLAAVMAQLTQAGR